MRYFKVKNFESFQHYKHGKIPPWIKLYNSILDDYEFGSLSDEGKCHLIMIWLLASRLENRIPLDPKWVQKQTGVSSEIEFDRLFDLGLIEEIQEDTKKKRGARRAPIGSQEGADREPQEIQEGSLEERREEERREEERREETEKTLAPSVLAPIPKKSELEFFIGEIREKYPGIDIAKEIRKMEAWLLTPKGKSRRLTKGFIVNWLNKIDVPIGTPIVANSPSPPNERAKILTVTLPTDEERQAGLKTLRESPEYQKLMGARKNIDEEEFSDVEGDECLGLLSETTEALSIKLNI